MKKYKNHIVVLGSARSGTSWLSELIAQQHRYRMLFEPEHEFNTPKGKLLCDKYLLPNSSDSNAVRYLKNIFKNRVDCDWIAQISNRKWKRHLWPFIPKKFIIKFVRFNLSAHLLIDKFQIPTIFIIRNPYDVLASQNRVRFPWLFDLSHFSSQPELCDLIQKEFGFDISNLQNLSDLERLSLRWCIENSVPFINRGHDKIELYKQEDLRNDKNLFLKICKDHQLEPLGNLDKIYSKPSSKTHPKSKVRTGKSPDPNFTADEYQTINKYLDIFKIDFYPRQN